MHMDADTVLLQVELSEDSPLAYHSLAEVGLGRDSGVQVLSIVRSPKRSLSQSRCALPLDQLVVVVPSKNVQTLISLMKGRVIDGEV